MHKSKFELRSKRVFFESRSLASMLQSEDRDPCRGSEMEMGAREGMRAGRSAPSLASGRRPPPDPADRGLRRREDYRLFLGTPSDFTRVLFCRY
mgnify:CR=1 FL=1